MSISIIKAGIFDTIQDAGRYGYRSAGINPGGVMDHFSAGIVNALTVNNINAPVIECHFPASSVLIEQDMMLAIGGADFSPSLNGVPIPLWKPVIAAAGSVLEHKRIRNGARTYIAFREKTDVRVWLNSCSTNTKLSAGGWQGRLLQKNDRIQMLEKHSYPLLHNGTAQVVLPWQAAIHWQEENEEAVGILPGPEYEWLDKESKKTLEERSFTISHTADRMGYQLLEELPYRHTNEMLSSATAFGTVQLLPGGKMIVLMADHQVSGGYPRIAQVITAHLPLLAQKKPGEPIRFRIISQQEAEEQLLTQRRHIVLLQHACRYKLEAALSLIGRDAYNRH
ncbi:MAG: biotin-dependent carboxyltransferase family protein [Chitinophagaceae bacterium]|nr:biotin-dependent carboxyltransferase family protein [Chitinophagaceae bacterium]